MKPIVAARAVRNSSPERAAYRNVAMIKFKNALIRLTPTFWRSTAWGPSPAVRRLCSSRKTIARNATAAKVPASNEYAGADFTMS
jgi:hypothetical protein